MKNNFKPPPSLLRHLPDVEQALVASPFAIIGRDMIWEIFSFLTFHELYRISLVCRAFSHDSWHSVRVITSSSLKMSNKQIALLCQKCTNVEKLEIVFNNSVTNDALISIGNLRKLKSLSLRGQNAKNVTNSVIMPLIQQKSQLMDLQELTLVGQISKIGLRSLFANFPNLTSLDISGCFQNAGRMQDYFLLDLIKSLPNLVYLNIRSCHQATPATLNKIVNSSPNLKISLLKKIQPQKNIRAQSIQHRLLTTNGARPVVPLSLGMIKRNSPQASSVSAFYPVNHTPSHINAPSRSHQPVPVRNFAKFTRRNRIEVMDGKFHLKKLQRQQKKATESKEDQTKLISRMAIDTFLGLGLNSSVCDAIKKAFPRIERPSAIQRLGIPSLLGYQKVPGNDQPKKPSTNPILMAAPTGTGKTLAYLLPIVQRLREAESQGIETRPGFPRAIVVVPSRELEDQIFNLSKTFSHHYKFRVANLTSNRAPHLERKILSTKQIDLLITTPHRLKANMGTDRVRFTDLNYLVIDEADTLFENRRESDFGTDIQAFLERAHLRKPESKFYHQPTQVVLVSATFTRAFKELVNSQMPDMEVLEAVGLHKEPEKLEQRFVDCESGDRHPPLLSALDRATDEGRGNRTLIFCNSIKSARATEHFLNENMISATSVHGEIPPEKREKNWKDFLGGKFAYLVATDVASRGIDIENVDHVVNFDFPLNVIDYLHRIGRTARFDKPGLATSLVCKKDRVLANAIKNAIQKGQSLERLSANKDDYAKGGALEGWFSQEQMKNLLVYQPEVSDVIPSNQLIEKKKHK